ncbi:hypothetical protein HDU87_003395 [Geranomyces variabilis]|uniref:Uncharacterized protein n=1 Tax=Geranomyces variabilis TaxID=109894 RepID=A0AAD5TAL7_9FUNG|nr:hypothetical protein HDU87_003395 [Geranomyces variabilis]
MCLDAAVPVDDGTMVFATVNGFNGAGAASSTSSSNGGKLLVKKTQFSVANQIIAVTLDLTPPDNFNVTIKTQTGLAFVRDIEEVSASWTASYDAQSGISGYQVALQELNGTSTTILNDYVISDLSNPLKTQALIRSRTYLVHDNDQVQVCVKAYNVAGLSTTCCSDPVTLDTGRPTLNYRRYLNQTAPLTPFYVTNVTSVDFSWSWTAVSGISA